MKRLLALTCFICLFTQAGFSQRYKERPVSQQELPASLKNMAAGCFPGETITELSLNNVRTWIGTDGSLWSGLDYPLPGYEIPKNSGKSSIYSGGLWIGGTDVNGQLKVTASTYAGGGPNYWPGPLKADGPDRSTTDAEVCYRYDQHFPISRFDVESFREWYNTPFNKRDQEFSGYSVPQTILDWPAHGDAAAGYEFNLAPFWDNNDDGLYNPMDGDYPFFDLDGILPCGSTRETRVPRLYGDAALWWVINDRGNIHQFPFGDAIGMEIRSQAFEFSTNDALNDMSFYNFTLINRSTYTLYETYIGIYADGDVGDWNDDFAGCDVSKGIGYFYNGDAVDGEGEPGAYGANPPAIGFDFFEGPYQDRNGQDDCTSYDSQYNLICNDCILNGNINGLNFGDGIVDNERWGMSGFFSFFVTGCVGCDPFRSTLAYYQYMRGYHQDNQHIRYGGNGHPSNGGTGPDCNFGFPGNSDPCGWGQRGIPMPAWTEETAGKAPGDRRMVQSSGPFTMEPGAVNDLTIGVVWARSYDGGLMASVDKMLLADEKAQRLFDNCFRVVDGPDAPELTIVERDQKLIFYLWNKPSSNNYMEKYRERDPFIVCPADVPDCDTDYSFEGYQVWQVKDPSVPMSEVTAHNGLKAREVFQTDIRNGIGRLINFYWDPVTESSQSVIEVSGSDQGIQHTFEVTADAFTAGTQSLVNFRKYYYVAVAYACNNYQKYGQSNMESLEGQKLPYLAGRKGAGGPVKIFEAIPHKIEPEGLRLVWGFEEISSPLITRIEGHGNGLNNIDITQTTLDEIMKGPPWKAENLEYVPGRGPIKVTVVDPMNVKDHIYLLKFDSVNSFISPNFMNGKVIDANWHISNSKGDTVFSESWIATEYEQLIPQWGLSVSINQVAVPFQAGAIDNGFIDATIEYSDPDKIWLKFISDDDRNVPRNWIRSGYNDKDSQDKNSVYENILGGTWTPFRMASSALQGPAYDPAKINIGIKNQRLSSIDLYITSNRSRWTRSPVLEMTDDWRLSIGQAAKFDLRVGQSIDKAGKPAPTGSGASENESDPNYMSETGMGWFPGYAIDVETGERLNIVYGESSFLTGDHGADMAWNPSAREGSKLYDQRNGLNSDYSDVIFGGKHYIYVMGHNCTMPGKNDPTFFPGYDAGAYYMEKMATVSKDKKKELLMNAAWTAIPLLDTLIIKEKEQENDLYGYLPIQSDMKIRLRVAGQYSRGTYDFALPDSLAQNNNNPMYTINTRWATHYVKDNEVSVAALDLIRVVPNPYYGYSEYQQSQADNCVKITNLPKICTISIYSLNGNLIRRFTKDSDRTFIDWDLKNQYGISIASGAYIVYVDAPGIGHKTVKFFGALRPQNLSIH